MKIQLEHRLQYWLILLTLMVTVELPTGTSAADNSLEQRKQPLYVLVTAPYPDPNENVWDGGISLIPAVRLAFYQINQHPGILPNHTLELIEDDSGCSWYLLSKVFHSFTRAKYYSLSNNTELVGIIGPACSDPTLAIAPLLAKPEVNMLQIAATATSPEVEKSRYNTTVTMISSFLVFIDCMVDLMKCNKWFQVGILIDDLGTPTLYKNSILNFTQQLRGLTEYTVSYTYSAHDDEYLNFLERVRSKRVRIILAFGGKTAIQKIMCLAYYSNTTYPQYQWILNEQLKIFNTNFMLKYEENQYNCSREIMAKAVNGSIIINYNLMPDDNSLIAETNHNFSAYRELYYEWFNHHWEEPKVQAILDKVFQETHKMKNDFLPSGLWENSYYDAGWALGLALDKLTKEGYNLNPLLIREPGFTQLLIKKLLDVSFNGATGPVNFNKQTKSVDTRLSVTQVFMNRTGELTDLHLATYKHRNLTCPTQFSFISHEFQHFLTHIDISVGTTIIFITSILVITLGLLQTAYVAWRHDKSIKAASPNITHFSFLGCYFLAFALVTYAAQQSFLSLKNIDAAYPIMCQAVMWCLMLGSSLILSTIFVQIWRLYKVFRHFGNKSPGRLLSDTTLICFVVLFLIIDTIICSGWTLISPWTLSKKFTVEYSIVFVLPNCTCQGIEYWIACVVVYKGGIALTLVTISILNRKIQRKHFSHTKKVNTLVYSLTILGGVGFPLYFLLRDGFSIYLSYLIMCMFFLLSLFLCTLLLFSPPVIPALKSKLGITCSHCN